MKTTLLVLLTLTCFVLADQSQSAQTDSKGDALAKMADIYWIPTNKVEWKCPAAILGLDFTNDVAYVVKNIQTNRCGVFVVSYPAQSPSKAPVILEWVADPRPVSFRLKVAKAPVHPSNPPTFPVLEVVEHIEVTLGPLVMPDGERRTYFANVDIGKIFYTSQTDVMLARISEATLMQRRFGK